MPSVWVPVFFFFFLPNYAQLDYNFELPPTPEINRRRVLSLICYNLLAIQQLNNLNTTMSEWFIISLMYLVGI